MVKFLTIGAAHWDILGRSESDMALYDDVPGRIRRMIGGVAGPIAMKLGKLGADVALIGYAGRDELGDALLAKLSEYRINTEMMIRGDLPTDIYMGIEAPNGMVAAIADCHSLEAISKKATQALFDNHESRHVIIDGNLQSQSLEKIADETSFKPASLTLIPASPGKINRLTPFTKRNDARLIVNLREANRLTGQPHQHTKDAAQALLQMGFQSALVSNGEKKASFANQSTRFSALPPQITVKRFTGAGDTLAAHHIYAITNGQTPQAALEYALDETAQFISREDLDA